MVASLNPCAWTSQRARHRCVLIAIVCVLAIAALALLRLDASALCALPALALPLLLALRRYPGERFVAALSRARRVRRPRAPQGACPAPRAFIAVPRGGLLLARSLAVRPPPRASLAAG
jgi:hypothetical protein